MGAKSKWVAKGSAVLVMLIGACVTTRLRPPDGRQLNRVETSYGECRYELIPVEPGVCTLEEKDPRPGRLGQNRLMQCGEETTVCEQSVRCDCSRPKRLFDCEPERTVLIHGDGGISPVIPTRADGTPLPPLGARRFKGKNEYGDCEFSMGAPRMGHCQVGGLIPNKSEEWVATGMYVPFGEERELCGVRLSCRCEEFTERE